MKKFNFFAILFFLNISLIFASERPIIRNLVANGSNGTEITISWVLPKNPEPEIKNLSVYKSNKPITSYYDLEDLKPVKTLDANIESYSDEVKDYNDYYYAVVANTSVGRYEVILPSINSTVYGTHLRLPKISEKAKSTASAKERIVVSSEVRSTPLPYLDLIDLQNHKTIKMKEETLIKARKLQKSSGKNKNIITEPYFFEEDLISPDSGDDVLLFKILSEHFIQKEYKESVYELERLIGTNISKEVSNRSYFYLAQAYYFSGDYKTATMNFLKIYNVIPNPTKKWLESSLDLYQIPSQS